MAIRLVKDQITRTELKDLIKEDRVETVKAVADVRRGIIGFGGDMHHDIERTMIEDGSLLRNLWGFSLFLDRSWRDAFEFRSHVNVRPEDGNPSIQINDMSVRQSLVTLASKRIDWDA
jgi:hypothetical protein